MKTLALRVTSSALTIAMITAVVFLSLRALPGDPVELMLGESAAPAHREELRAKLGLDQSLSAQTLQFTSRLAHGDLGESLTRHKPVTTLIARALPNTVVLALVTALAANLFGIPLGALAAFYRRESAGRLLFSTLVFLAALPVFWIAPLLIIAFALRWPWLPISSFQSWSGIILPAAAQALVAGSHLGQATRAAVLEALSGDYIRTAEAKGAGPWRVLFQHALPVAATPILTLSTLQLGHLLAGSVLVETIFDWPGIGKLLYDSILARDYPTVQGVVLVIAITYVLLNATVDLILRRKALRGGA